MIHDYPDDIIARPNAGTGTSHTRQSSFLQFGHAISDLTGGDPETISQNILDPIFYRFCV